MWFKNDLSAYMHSLLLRNWVLFLGNEKVCLDRLEQMCHVVSFKTSIFLDRMNGRLFLTNTRYLYWGVKYHMYVYMSLCIIWEKNESRVFKIRIQEQLNQFKTTTNVYVLWGLVLLSF